MTLAFDGAALKIRRADGTVKFNSDEGLFHVTQQFSNVGGVAISLPVLSKTTTYNSGLQTNTVADQTTEVVIGATDPNANYLLGFIRPVWSSFPQDHPLSTNPWRDASGTHIEMTAQVDLRNPRPDSFHYVNGIGTLSIMTFLVSGQQLIFRERICMRASNAQTGATNTITRPAVTVEYRILVGYFL